MDRNHDRTPPGPLVAGPRPTAKRSRRGLSRWRRWAHAAIAPVAVAVVTTLWRTYRLAVGGAPGGRELLESGGPAVITLWHEGAFVVAPYLRRLALDGVEITYLVSPSVDGDLVTRIVERIGGRVVRGSATRSGVQAMRLLYRDIVRRGSSTVLLPDGPHGPVRVCKEGALLVARLSGAPVLPMACASSRQWRLRTWDRLRVPCPFAAVRIRIGAPMAIPRDADDAAMAEHRATLVAALDRLEREAARGEP